MSSYSENSKKHFIEIYKSQSNLFNQVLNTKPTTPVMDYLSKGDIYKSHFIRQKTFPQRLPFARESPRNTLELLLNGLGQEKSVEFVEKGYIPREPPISFSYFIGTLVQSLDVPKEVGVYLSTLRTTIGCCDDLIDKNHYYNVFGENLFYLSHFMLDLGELALSNENLLSEEVCRQISEINRELLKTMREGEEEQELFKKSFSQGLSFAKIACLFSSSSDSFKKRIQEASGHYDFGGHIFGEIVDQKIGEPNYLDQKNKTPQEAYEEAIREYNKAIEICPDCELRNCFIDEKELFETKFHEPKEFEEALQKRKKSKEEFPTTFLMQIKKSTS